MSAIDWWVLSVTLTGFVVYGLWRSRAHHDVNDLLVSGRSLRWPAVALTVMATQASAITFMATPGQGFADGLRFVQFYFGLPLAMVILCVTAIPAYHRMKVFTAYEYLERRFDGKTRTLATLLFLVQRGLAAGITIYAPALILSVLLGWDVRWMCVLLGALVVVYTATGGSRAVSHTHVLQFVIILSTMAVAFVLIVSSLPQGVDMADGAHLAGVLGRMRALEMRFDPNDRYNLWSGLLGGLFLQLSYFGTDQSQVGRYLGGQSVAQSRLGLLFNGLFKIPMQFGILFLGVMVFVFFLFTPAPLSFNPAQVEKAGRGPHAAAWSALERDYAVVEQARAAHARDYTAARHAGHPMALAQSRQGLEATHHAADSLRARAGELIVATIPSASTRDTNYVFLGFVLHHLPVGIIGLVIAAIFAASMNSTSAELNALASTTLVDVWRRLRHDAAGHHDVMVTRVATVAWTVFAVGFAGFADRLGSLIEAVNILGSLFYGTLLGMFMTGFLIRRVGGTAVFTGALVAQILVLACFRFTSISFLWYNVIGCATVMAVAVLVSLGRAGRAPANARP